jgi:hypothetical protein
MRGGIEHWLWNLEFDIALLVQQEVLQQLDKDLREHRHGFELYRVSVGEGRG